MANKVIKAFLVEVPDSDVCWTSGGPNGHICEWFDNYGGFSRCRLFDRPLDDTGDRLPARLDRCKEMPDA